MNIKTFKQKLKSKKIRRLMKAPKFVSWIKNKFTDKEEVIKKMIIELDNQVPASVLGELMEVFHRNGINPIMKGDYNDTRIKAFYKKNMDNRQPDASESQQITEAELKKEEAVEEKTEGIEEPESTSH